jgi:hypothetical protein
MVQQKVDPVEDPNNGGGGELTGEAIVTSPKKSIWQIIIDFFKKLFGIS